MTCSPRLSGVVGHGCTAGESGTLMSVIGDVCYIITCFQFLFLLCFLLCNQIHFPHLGVICTSNGTLVILFFCVVANVTL